MKRIPLDAKVSAYNDTIDFLMAMESDSDTDDDRAARKWLADKLDKEADRLVYGRHRIPAASTGSDKK